MAGSGISDLTRYGEAIVAESRHLRARAAGARERAAALQWELKRAWDCCRAVSVKEGCPDALGAGAALHPSILDAFLKSSDDPYPHAKIMVDSYGQHAYRHALVEAVDRRTRRDIDGLQYWQSVLQAIREVQSVRPAPKSVRQG